MQNPRRTRVRESLKAHAITILITLTGSIRKTLGKRRRLNRKKLATLHRVVSQVEFSLVLAFLEPLEGSAVEKCAECVTLAAHARRGLISGLACSGHSMY